MKEDIKKADSFYDYLLHIPDEEKRKEAYRAIVDNNIDISNESWRSGIEFGKNFVRGLSWIKRLFIKF